MAVEPVSLGECTVLVVAVQALAGALRFAVGKLGAGGGGGGNGRANGCPPAVQVEHVQRLTALETSGKAVGREVGELKRGVAALGRGQSRVLGLVEAMARRQGVQVPERHAEEEPEA